MTQRLLPRAPELRHQLAPSRSNDVAGTRFPRFPGNPLSGRFLSGIELFDGSQQPLQARAGTTSRTPAAGHARKVFDQLAERLNVITNIVPWRVCVSKQLCFELALAVDQAAQVVFLIEVRSHQVLLDLVELEVFIRGLSLLLIDLVELSEFPVEIAYLSVLLFRELAVQELLEFQIQR